MTHIHEFDIDAYMDEHGYTRGVCNNRGKLVLMGADVRVMSFNRSIGGYDISEPMTQVEAEAEVMGARPQVSPASFREATSFEQFLADHDGPKGYGR